MLAGHILAAIKPDDQGLRLFDIRTGTPLPDLDRPERLVVSLVANAESERLLTIELVIGPLASGTASPRTGADPFRNPEVEVNLWDVNSREVPIAKLEVPESDLPRRSMIMAAFSPDGKTLALAYSINRSAVVSLFSAASGKLLDTIDTQAEQIVSLALGANNMMATAAGRHDPALGPGAQDVSDEPDADARHPPTDAFQSAGNLAGNRGRSQRGTLGHGLAQAARRPAQHSAGC